MKNFAISGGHDLTVDAAKEILLSGGNAIDAAIAAYAMSFISEPCMASTAAGGFANIYTQDKKSIILDFFCQTPKNKNHENVSFFPIEVDFGVASETFHIGLGSAATPGAIAGIYKMHELFGSIPLKELFQPAIIKAKEGIEINDFQHYDLQLLKEIFYQDARSREIFFDGDDIKKVGQKTYSPNFADFMESLALEGQDLFYKGEIAVSIANDCSEFGGFLNYNDFTDYEVNVRKPIKYHFKDRDILLPGFPSLGGGLMVLFLDQIKDANKEYDYLSIEHLNALYAAEKYTDKYKRNPLKLQSAIIEILDDLPDSFIQNLIKLGGTTHLNVVDNDNNAVSLTTSIGEGCGYMIKNTDMMMNNMLGESALLPEGLHSWTADKRLYSMMTPTVITNKEGRVELSLGSGGAGRIPFMIAQVLTNYILYEKDLHISVNSPRVHYGHGIFNVENGYGEGKIIVDSETKIQKWDSSLFFGGVHSISVEEETYDAVGDERRDGVSFVKRG